MLLCPGKRRRAYTLTELLVVIAIASILLGMGYYLITAGQRAGEKLVAEALGSRPISKERRPVRQVPKGPDGKAAIITIQDRHIVVFQDNIADAQAEVARLAQQIPMQVVHVYNSAIKGFAAHVTKHNLPALRQAASVKYLQPDLVVHAAVQSTPTGVRRIGADALTGSKLGNPPKKTVQKIGPAPPQNLGFGAPGGAAGSRFGDFQAVVAVIDTGVDDKHPDLNVTLTKGFGFPDATDTLGHGTHVAGTVGARGNTIGVIGVAPGIRIWGLKVLDGFGAGTTADVIAAVDFCAVNSGKVQIVNMSLGIRAVVPAVNLACDNLVKKGVVVTVSAMNTSEDASNWSPASAPSVITVAALADSDGKPGGKGPPTPDGKDDSFATFSNFGTIVDVIAPGVDIQSTLPGGSYGLNSGTSMAAPHVAGLAAIILDPGQRGQKPENIKLPGQAPKLVNVSPAGVLNLILQTSVESIPGPGRTYPLINARPF